MAFCNSDIKEALRESSVKFSQSSPVLHCCRDGHKGRLLLSHIAHDFSEYIRVRIFLLFFQRRSGPDIKRSCAVEPGRFPLCRKIPLSFLCHYMEKDCAFYPLCLFKGADQFF